MFNAAEAHLADAECILEVSTDSDTSDRLLEFY